MQYFHEIEQICDVSFKNLRKFDVNEIIIKLLLEIQKRL